MDDRDPGAPELAVEARFELLRRAGEGGSAEVWQARDLALGGEVALKLARGELGRAALAREAAHAAATASPRLPELVDAGFLRIAGGKARVVDERDGGRAFVALRWVDGASLDARESGRDPPDLALVVARDVGEALAELHGLGVAHGDVAPKNVVVDAGGRAHLIDLGLACAASAPHAEGGTPRYLALGDADLGTARERDLLALGVVVAELADASIARAAAPLAATRAQAGRGVVGAICGGLSTPSPHARPSAAWVAEMAREGLAGRGAPAPGNQEDGAAAALRARRLRAAYLRVRRGELEHASGTQPGVAPWLGEAIDRARSTRRLRVPEQGEPRGGTTLGPLEPVRIAEWLAAVVGPSVASWSLDALASAPERDLASAMGSLAARGPLEAITLADVERALRGEAGSSVPASAPRLGPPAGDERIATIALGLAAVPPEAEAMGDVERWEGAPIALVIAAADALRRTGQLGRARTLVLRAPDEPRAAGLGAEVLRRAGDRTRALELATRAIASGNDPGGRARAVVARIAFDEGRIDDALELTRDATAVGVCEVAALAAAARGDATRALAMVARGEAFARDAEDRARLAGVRGYVLHGSDPARSREAYARAVDHAVRAGAVVEEATYRMGEAASAVDTGAIGVAIEAARRSVILWEHLGRPALAARAELARAAALATAGAHLDATRAARSAVARARECGDARAGAYARWAIADACGADAADAREAAVDAARAITELGSGRLRQAMGGPGDEVDGRRAGREGALTEDEVRAAARLLQHCPEAVDARLASEIDDRALTDEATSPAARLEWLGARAAALAASPAAEFALPDDRIVAAICSLADARAPVGTRGPALAAGLALAERGGHGAEAQRLLAALAEVARDLVLGAPPELAASVRSLPWVARAATRPEMDLRPEQARELEALVRTLGDREGLRSLLRRVVDALVLWTGVERGLLLLRAPDGRLVPRAARNLARADLHGEQLALSQTLARRALEAREPVVAVDAAGELPSVHQSVHALKLRSVLAVPLLARGEAIGVVYLDDRGRRGAFGERELSWTRTIAALAALAIADARDQVLLRRAVRRASRASADLADALALREAALDVAERELAKTRDGNETRFEYAAIIGQSEPVRAMLAIVDRVTTSDVPVLLAGESGSGKELVARAIHVNGPRASRPFVSENCGAIPEGLLESALFGHVRGAFTGADRPRAGLFDVADGGTLFLDEVGEMSLGMQTKLLRVLEDGLVRPVGTEKARKVDVRIVAATHRDLPAMVKARTFREDLLYRLAIITIAIPPLRERPADVALLVEHFLRKHGRGAAVRITRAALDRLTAYAWPGNVRQLENEIRRALVLSDGTIDRAHLSPDIAHGSATAARDLGLGVRARIDALEADLVREAMRRTGDNQTQAAKLLGLSRFGLQKMIKRLGLA